MKKIKSLKKELTRKKKIDKLIRKLYKMSSYYRHIDLDSTQSEK